MPPLITPLPPAPGPDRPTTLETDTQAFLDALTDNLVPETNALATWMEAQASLLALAAEPSGITFAYTFDSATTDSDPGAGLLRLSSATQNASTVIRCDLVDNIGQTVTTLLDLLDDSTSSLKGYLRIAKVGDATKWLIFSISAVASPSGYRNITVAPVAWSATNPFTAGDHLVMGFVRNGDRGMSAFQNILAPIPVTGTPTALTLGPIPAGYGEIKLDVGVVLSTSAILRLLLSNDGTTYTSPIGLGTSTGFDGTLHVNDIGADRGDVTFEYFNTSPLIGSPPDAVAYNSRANGAWWVPGGVNYLRLAPSAGNFTASNGIRLVRAR